jgi:hypothetical protein
MSESGALDSLRKDFGMPKLYSDDLRGRAIVIVEGGASRHEVPNGDTLHLVPSVASNLKPASFTSSIPRP